VGDPDIEAFEQTVHYITMNGERRAAVTAEAKNGCVKEYFVSWVPSGEAANAEKDMIDFLQALHFEDVKKPEHGQE
jgi:hypothetical protein